MPLLVGGDGKGVVVAAVLFSMFQPLENVVLHDSSGSPIHSKPERQFFGKGDGIRLRFGSCVTESAIFLYGHRGDDFLPVEQYTGETCQNVAKSGKRQGECKGESDAPQVLSLAGLGDDRRDVAEWSGAGSNRRHTDFQSVALPTELPDRELGAKRLEYEAMLGLSIRGFLERP